MTSFIIAVFIVTYLGMAIGRVPGLRIDRTGIALLALAALLAGGALGIGDVGRAIDAPTLLLLFALMLVSAQFGIAGFYDLCARAITRSSSRPSTLLAVTVVVGGVLSAVLANDIVVFAMTPLLCAGLKARGADPRPYLLGLAGAANAGSAATVIGNPQNILIGQVGQLDFGAFLLACGVPAVIALLIVHVSVLWLWRNELGTSDVVRAPMDDPIAADRWQIAKGLVATLALIGLFVSPVPREIAALAVAAVLLISRRMASREMLSRVDWQLLLLFTCLFAITGAFASTGVAKDGLAWLGERGALPDNLLVLTPLALVASNTIGNVPAVVLLLSIWPDPPTGAMYGLALLSTLAGNFLLTGSLANIIVAERAEASGVRLSFADFARAGVPMTVASMAIAVLWLGLLGYMPWW
ncbi:MAG: anion transporter [Alphaproteobacteria bacterium]|nr:anion transporter [Alphaproteobacteria bacterium]